MHIDKLLGILFSEIGIRGTAFAWFKSYLCGRSQKVKIGNAFSEEVILEFGVPQGSVLGPVLFNIYIRSFYQTVRLNSSFDVQGYADDHQLYSSFSMSNQAYMLGTNILNTLTMVKHWMNSYCRAQEVVDCSVEWAGGREGGGGQSLSCSEKG